MSDISYEITQKGWIREGQTKGHVTIRGGRITYNAIGYTDDFSDPEEKVRAALYLELIDKFNYQASKDVIEMEKRHKIGHPHKKTDAIIDIIVKKNKKPFMMFELKSPDDYERDMDDSIKTQLFNVAAVEDKGGKNLKYLIYYTRYEEEGELREKIITIDYTKFKSYDDWEDDGKPNLMLIPKEYGIVRKPVFVKKGTPDLRINVKKDELERIRLALHQILWGGGKYQNELFFNLVGLFLVKIYDEKETEDGEPYAFQVFNEDGEPESSDRIYERINGIYKGDKAVLRKYYGKEDGPLTDSNYLGISKSELSKIPDIVFDSPKVRYVVETLQDICFTTNRYDVIGNFFEGIVRGEFKQTKGQYLTHTNIVDFIIRALDLEDLSLNLINTETRLPLIMDPACGSGTFLIESMKYITKFILSHGGEIKKSDAVKEFIRYNFPEYRQNFWAREYVYGIEIMRDLATATKVNMVGHGDGSANIEALDALLDFEKYTKAQLQIKKQNEIYEKPVNEQFDVVMSNPPFRITVDRDTAKSFPGCFLQGEKIAKSLKREKGEKEIDIENLFIERWYQLLKPKGRLGVVLPESVFDTTSNRDIRLFLYKYFWIKAVVSMPHLAFAPYTMTKTSLLFAQKKTEDEVREWNEMWKKYSEEYKDLMEEIRILLLSNNLKDKTMTWVSDYLGTAQILFDKNEFEAEYNKFDEGLENIEAVDKFENNYFEFLEEYLGELIDNFDKTDFKGMMKRKKTLVDLINERINQISKKEESIEKLKKLVQDNYDENDRKLSLNKLKKKYEDDIKLANLDWWVFSQISKEIDYPIFMAHAEEIGYKRGARKEEKRPNQLFQIKETDEGKEIIIDTENPKAILDYLRRDVIWN
ncbi:MAG: N-6 DNA methylase [Methanophagales archaeon]|nr:N-6 DNA methylase [Methanophagales archaeon]